MTRFGPSFAAVVMGAWATAALGEQGWTVSICRGQTEAAQMNITVGDGTSGHELVHWRSDNRQTTFAVPGPLGNAEKLTVEIDSMPPDGKATACVLWRGTPAKTMKFTDQLTATVAKTDRDNSCPCK
ncbi:MAG: hypothetical protein AB7V27_01120 [Candidatus Binatia bacterium]